MAQAARSPASSDVDEGSPAAAWPTSADVAADGVRYVTPGGETIDALVVWMPEHQTAFIGNLMGPFFGHVPNLYTLRGDKIRSAMAFIHSMPMPISFHSASSKPNGMATSPSIPAGMIQAETMGIARRLASTP